MTARNVPLSLLSGRHICLSCHVKLEQGLFRLQHRQHSSHRFAQVPRMLRLSSRPSRSPLSCLAAGAHTSIRNAKQSFHKFRDLDWKQSRRIHSHVKGERGRGTKVQATPYEALFPDDVSASSKGSSSRHANVVRYTTARGTGHEPKPDVAHVPRDTPERSDASARPENKLSQTRAWSYDALFPPSRPGDTRRYRQLYIGAIANSYGTYFPANLKSRNDLVSIVVNRQSSLEVREKAASDLKSIYGHTAVPSSEVLSKPSESPPSREGITSDKHAKDTKDERSKDDNNNAIQAAHTKDERSKDEQTKDEHLESEPHGSRAFQPGKTVGQLVAMVKGNPKSSDLRKLAEYELETLHGFSAESVKDINSGKSALQLWNARKREGIAGPKALLRGMLKNLGFSKSRRASMTDLPTRAALERRLQSEHLGKRIAKYTEYFLTEFAELEKAEEDVKPTTRENVTGTRTEGSSAEVDDTLSTSRSHRNLLRERRNARKSRETKQAPAISDATSAGGTTPATNATPADDATPVVDATSAADATPNVLTVHPDEFGDVQHSSIEAAMLRKRDDASPAPATRKETSRETITPASSRKKSKDSQVSDHVQQVRPKKLKFEALEVEQPPVPPLAHGLDRVLFNPGVYQLQDQSSQVYNFDPYLQKIMPVVDFDFNALKAYKTSSEDQVLSQVAREYGRKYVGSTSSMTGSLGHFHYLISQWRELNVSMLSKGYTVSDNKNALNFTEIYKAPAAMFLRWQNGTYAIDADKEYDSGNVLMLLGKSMEKLLTMSVDDFERYRKGDPRGVTEEERTAPESYHYSTQGDFLMRSQLDSYDPRLPGTGMFDLKTRAVVSVRMRSEEYQDMTGYQLNSQYGEYESYDREYYDMIRSTLLKYSLQARMGRMEGIFMAYHNVDEIFGFRYLNMQEIDTALHGQRDTCLGDQEFKLSLELMNRILNKATEKFPEQSIRFHFETRQPSESTKNPPWMYIFAEPMAESEINKIQNSQKARISAFERNIMGLDTDEADAQKVRSKEAAGKVAENIAYPRDDTDAVAEALSSDEAEEADPSENDTNTHSSSRPDHEADTPSAPLLGMMLTIRNKINNTYVPRPTDLRPTDRWELEYMLTEIESPEKAASTYSSVKARRRKTLMSESQRVAEAEDPDADVPPAKGKGRPDYFIKVLKQLSAKGRAEREEREANMLGKEKVVVGAPVFQPTSSGTSKSVKARHVVVDDEGVKDVDSYMSWLFEKK